jgi:hypothetical protein
MSVIILYYSECGILGDFLQGELGATPIDTFSSVDTQGIHWSCWDHET